MGKIVFSLIFSISLLGCESDQDTRLQDSINNTSPTAIFNPGAGVIPFPSNLLFSGTTDGTLNIPVDDPLDLSDPKVAMNSLDGFSTNTPITTTFRSPIDVMTITNGSGVPANVRLFKASINDFHTNPGGPPNFAVLSIASELLLGVDFGVTVSSETTLVIVPLKPLVAKSGYVVVITNGLHNTVGQSYLPDTTYAIVKETESLIVGGASRLPALSLEQATALEGLRLLTNATENAVNTFDNTLATTDIILSWSFSTQSTSDVLENEKAELSSDVPTLSAFVKIPDLVKQGLEAAGAPISDVDVYTGTIDVPYYLDKNDALNSVWKGVNGDILSLLNGKNPVATETLSIPVLVTVPSAAVYDSGSIPVVIYQHGIMSNRMTGLALANSLAGVGVGYAMVAIDLPLHGVTDTTFFPFYDEVNERTFNLDLVDSNRAPGADGNIDSTGTHFINLPNLQTSRDNVRQAVMDLFTLVKAINLIDVDSTPNGVVDFDFDPDNISFIGHSLGGIVGIPFLALEPNVKSAVIAMAGGGIAKILDGSASFGPQIANGLAVKGVLKGTADYEGFMLAAQTVLDSADPLNYAPAAAISRGFLLFEIVGDGLDMGSPPDLVIPNSVADDFAIPKTVDAPLAGTNPLISLMGLTQTATDVSGTELKTVVKFRAGHHSSLLTTENISGNSNVLNSSEVYSEMHSILKEFINSNGDTVDITDASVIAVP